MIKSSFYSNNNNNAAARIITSSYVDIILSRFDRVYKPGEEVSGLVVIGTHHETMSLSAIRIHVIGKSELQVSTQKAGLLESLYASIDPYQFFEYSFTIPLQKNLW